MFTLKSCSRGRSILYYLEPEEWILIPAAELVRADHKTFLGSEGQALCLQWCPQMKHFRTHQIVLYNKIN